jgi:hypothetical protein
MCCHDLGRASRRRPTNLNSDGLVDIVVFYSELMTQSKVGVFLNAAQ